MQSESKVRTTRGLHACSELLVTLTRPVSVLCSQNQIEVSVFIKEIKSDFSKILEAIKDLKLKDPEKASLKEACLKIYLYPVYLFVWIYLRYIQPRILI